MQGAEQEQGYFYDLVVRLRDDTFAFADWVFDSTEMKNALTRWVVIHPRTPYHHNTPSLTPSYPIGDLTRQSNTSLLAAYHHNTPSLTHYHRTLSTPPLPYSQFNPTKHQLSSS